MTVLHNICTTMGLLLQCKRRKFIFTGRRAVQILLIMKRAGNLMHRRLRAARKTAVVYWSRVPRSDIDAQARANAGGPAPDQAPADGRLAAAISIISASRRRIRDEVARSSEFTRCISIILRTQKRAIRRPKLAMAATPVEGFGEIATEVLPDGATTEALCLHGCPSQLIILRS
jgi:hypothetical protein